MEIDEDWRGKMRSKSTRFVTPNRPLNHVSQQKTYEIIITTLLVIPKTFAFRLILCEMIFLGWAELETEIATKLAAVP